MLMFVAVGVSTLAGSLIAIMTPAAYHPATRIVPLLSAFPLAPIALRFFTPSEWRDLKSALHLIRPGGLEWSTPAL